jgi:hypothetical protein
MKTRIEIGDKIKITTWYGKTIVRITRVTKTKAIAEIKRNDGSRYSYNFKRDCSHGIEPFGYIPFDTTTREFVNN